VRVHRRQAELRDEVHRRLETVDQGVVLRAVLESLRVGPQIQAAIGQGIRGVGVGPDNGRGQAVEPAAADVQDAGPLRAEQPLVTIRRTGF
jgi:hypothetical protein